MVCASTVNPIKIKLITKGKHTKHGGGGIDTGVGSNSRTESKVTDEKKKDKRDLRELRVCQIALLFCSPLVSLERLPVLKRRCRRGHCNKCHL